MHDPRYDDMFIRSPRARSACPGLTEKLARFGGRFMDRARTISLDGIMRVIAPYQPARIYLELAWTHDYTVIWQTRSPRGTTLQQRTLIYPDLDHILTIDDHYPMVQWEQRSSVPFRTGTVAVYEIFFVG